MSVSLARKQRPSPARRRKANPPRRARNLCVQPAPTVRSFAAGVDPRRARFIMTNGKKWVNGTQLSYLFLEGAKAQQAVVRQAFATWKRLGIGLEFGEVATTDAAIIRIGFDHTDGSWRITSLRVHEAAPIAAASGGQDDFEFKPATTRKYTIQTAGNLDTVMVVSERVGKRLHYLAGDDDSGLDSNARIRLPLVEGRTYAIKVRVLYASDARSGNIIVT